MEGCDFARLMTTEILGEEAVSLEGLCDILRRINPKADMAPQSLSERMNRKESVEYLRKVFDFSLESNLEILRKNISPALLSPFGRVFLEDSTEIALNEKLGDEFRGSGGKAAKSALKIDLIYEVKQSKIHNVLASEGTVPDRSRAELVVERLEENDLTLKDLGCFSLESLRKTEEKGAFYLSRMPKGVKVRLSDDGPAVDMVEYLENNFSGFAAIDLDVLLGDAKLPTRLVAYELPDGIVAERRRKALANAKKKGRKPSKEYLAWLKYGFFVTNVPPTTWDAEVVGTVYRPRWRIELIFKSWKSLLNIHILKGTRRERVECFVYGRLATVAAIAIFEGYASWYAFEYSEKEISSHKLTDWLKRKDRLAEAIRSLDLHGLFVAFKSNVKHLCKQKRKRKTTGQLLECGVPYMDSFSNDKNNSPIPHGKAV